MHSWGAEHCARLVLPERNFHGRARMNTLPANCYWQGEIGSKERRTWRKGRTERKEESIFGAHWIACLIFVCNSQSGAAAAPMMYYKRLIAVMHHEAPLPWWHVAIIHHQSVAQQEQESWKPNSSINYSTAPSPPPLPNCCEFLFCSIKDLSFENCGAEQALVKRALMVS